MALRPQTHTPGNEVQKHINTAYDTVREVALNLAAILRVSDPTSLTEITIVSNNIVSVNDVADDIQSGKLDAAIAAALSTAADLVVSNANTAQTIIDAATTTEDAIATAADKIATNADAVATGLDATQTALDVIAVADIFDQFQDNYLGALASDPTTDLDGDPLVAGTVYWNTTDSELKFYNGTVWEAPETSASTSAANALISELAAAASLLEFQAIYLGPKASEPTVDNEGDPLIVGALYFDTGLNQLKVYDGAAWGFATSLPGIVSNADATAITIGSDEKVSFADDISMVEGKILSWGANELLIYHSTNAIIKNTVGAMFIQQVVNSNLIYMQARDSGGVDQTCIRLGGAVPAVLLFYGGNEVLKTVNGGVRVPDNSSFFAGDSNDLTMYHDGTNSFLKSITGNLFLQQRNDSGLIYLQSDDSGGNAKTGIIIGGATPEVKLHHDGVQTLKTVANGVAIGTTDKLQLTHNESLGVIANAVGAFYLQENVNSGQFIFQSKDDAGNTKNVIIAGGATPEVKLYHDGIAVFSTIAGGVALSDKLLRTPEIKDYAITHTTPTSSSGAITFDCEVSNSFNVDLTENITTITLSNPPASGKYGEIVIEFLQDSTGGWTVAWPASVKWPGGTAPVITPTLSTGKDKVFLSTRDGGTTWLGDYSQAYS